MEDGVMVVEACNRMIPEEGEDDIEEGESRSWGVRLVVAEEAVIIAVWRHKRFEFWWDGWEEVALKADRGWDGRCVGYMERGRGK